MTEQYTPSDYDLHVQNPRLDELESLITAEYQPPEGVEYSYPVANQGITQTQFRNMMRALGKGTITQHNSDTAQSSYRLEPHASDAETNQRNTLLLRPAPTFNQAETASNGFFHVLTEAMELPFPSVTSKTTYYVCVTYDPRKVKTDPLKIEVYPGTPPTSEGRDHVVLFTVTRSPNQLLSQAPIGRINHWLGNVINAWSYNELPDPTTVEYGTLAVCLIPSSERDTGPELYSSRGVHGWIPVYDEEVVNPTLVNEWEHYSAFGAFKGRVSRGRVYLQGTIRRGIWSSGRNIARLPRAAWPSRTCFLSVNRSGDGVIPDIRINNRGEINISAVRDSSTPSWVNFDGVSYPLTD